MDPVLAIGTHRGDEARFLLVASQLPRGRHPLQLVALCLCIVAALFLGCSPALQEVFMVLRPALRHASVPFSAYWPQQRPRLELGSAPRRSDTVTPERRAGSRWPGAQPPRPLKARGVKTFLAFATGIALFMSSMAPEAAQAMTEMVNPQYLLAASDALHRTVGDMGALLAQHSQGASMPLATVETLNSVSRVFGDTAQEFSQLAASDAIGDIPGNGWFDQFVAIIENSILGLDQILTKANVPGALGVSITLFTMGIKAILFPLNYAQLKSSTQMQAVQPKVKELQERYKDTPEKLNLMLAELYRTNNVNPLVAIVPAFAQIPIFIGLYRALKHLGDLNLLDEPFLWLPSLEGPTFDLQPGHTLDWMTQGMLTPQDTLAYLTIPVLLVVSQTASTQLLKTPGQEIPTWVNFLPLLTASFSLNVPAGLSVYWIVNTVVSTLTNLGVKAYLQGDASIKAAAATDLDSLDIEKYKEAPSLPSYQEALLKVLETDTELAAAFTEMRQNPSTVMKYYGDQAFTTRLAESVQAKQQQMLEELKAKAADVKAIPAVPMKPKENLCIAVKAGNVTGVQAYLAAGVDPGFKDEMGISALHYAAGKGRVDLIKILVDAGGDLRIVDNDQNSLLHYAAGYGRDSVIQYLAERSVDFSPLNANRLTPLDLANAKDNKFITKKTLELLTKNGAKEGIGFGPVAPEVLDAAEGGQQDQK